MVWPHAFSSKTLFGLMLGVWVVVAAVLPLLERTQWTFFAVALSDGLAAMALYKQAIFKPTPLKSTHMLLCCGLTLVAIADTSLGVVVLRGAAMPFVVEALYMLSAACVMAGAVSFPLILERLGLRRSGHALLAIGASTLVSIGLTYGLGLLRPLAYNSIYAPVALAMPLMFCIELFYLRKQRLNRTVRYLVMAFISSAVGRLCVIWLGNTPQGNALYVAFWLTAMTIFVTMDEW